MLLEICMDWETYNVDLDDSQPVDADVSYEDPPAPDAERKMKLREETPDSKEGSTSSESIVVSTADSTNPQTLLRCFRFIFVLFHIDSGHALWWEDKKWDLRL